MVTRSDRHDRAVVVDGVNAVLQWLLDEPGWISRKGVSVQVMDRAVCVSQDSASTAWAVQQAHYAGQEVPAISVRIACQKCYRSCCSRSRVMDTNTSLQHHSIHRSYLADITGEHTPRSMATGLRTQSSKSTDRPLCRMRRYLFDPPFCDEDTTQGSDGARFSAAHCRANRLSSAAVYRLSLCLIFSQWVSIVFRLR